ncbi:MAG TPA: RsmD family RNA methyltransferase [Terriglobales bacterium]|nr:RsmD family RNA methyltransferase [Terriglobales bacterium]
MRITGGEMRSRRIEAPAGAATRPSADKLRQALFNILGPAVGAGWFVDAYAGSGAVGIEAWSRGARPVLWIERAPPALRALRANLAALGIAGAEAQVMARAVAPALGAIEHIPEFSARGGHVFLDPPYADVREYTRALEALGRCSLPRVRVIVEARRGMALPEQCGRLGRERSAVYGDSQLVFYTAAVHPGAAPAPAVPLAAAPPPAAS